MPSRRRDLQHSPMSWDGIFGSRGNDVVFFWGMGSITPRIALNFYPKMAFLFVQLQLFLNKVSSCEASSQMVASNPTMCLGLLEVNLHQTCWTAFFYDIIRPEVIVVIWSFEFLNPLVFNRKFTRFMVQLLFDSCVL